ncbi:MAG: CinA family protein, partial [Candidatus Thermoplasmatota archaeon]|nr:CinA family protein [Candidatus Thermoplasmatota archaeon]
DIAGASNWFNQSWVTYSNDAKMVELNVQQETLEKHGAVSAKVAIEMAKGALEQADADIAISITGIAGPGNDSTSKKVGTVYVGIASNTWANAESTQIGGNRSENKIGFVHFALLTAIALWDDAMEKAEANRKKLAEIEAQKELARKEFEIERAKREAAAKQSAPWQDESWSADGSDDEDESIGEEVEWN